MSRNQSVTREAQGGIRMFKTEARSLKTETRDFRKCDITTGRQPGIAIANIHMGTGKGYAREEGRQELMVDADVAGVVNGP